MYFRLTNFVVLHTIVTFFEIRSHFYAFSISNTRLNQISISVASLYPVASVRAVLKERFGPVSGAERTRNPSLASVWVCNVR